MKTANLCGHDLVKARIEEMYERRKHRDPNHLPDIQYAPFDILHPVTCSHCEGEGCIDCEGSGMQEDSHWG